MAWEMSGNYVANCRCPLIRSVDIPPNGPDGQGRGVVVFHIASGKLDDTDLSGANFAFSNLFPSNLTAGNWKVGVIVDEGASVGQAAALERILHGEEGGPFADFAALYGEWLGVERASVTFSDGDSPSGAVAGRASITFEPLPGPAGGVNTVWNAMFGCTPEFMIGKAPGHSDLFGLDFDGVYGETADFTFSSDMAEGAPKGRA